MLKRISYHSPENPSFCKMNLKDVHILLYWNGYCKQNVTTK